MISRKKIAYGRQLARSFERRQALPNAFAIRLGNQAWIANHQHAAIRLVPNQTPGALFQIDDRGWQLMMHETIQAFTFDGFDPCRQYRIIWWRKWQLVDNHHRQGIASHIDAFPKTLAADQHRIAGRAKTVSQFGKLGRATGWARVCQYR